MAKGAAVMLVALVAAARTAEPRHIFFMRSPTSAPKQLPFMWLQQTPAGFSADSFRETMSALGMNQTRSRTGKYRVGLTFQWEMLDCFLSPHSCNTSQTVAGIRTFLASAAETGTPVQVTLDVVQFYYASGLWNWFDPTQPGFDLANVNNVEWTDWSPDNATLIAWRNWGSQFRMPTPQPNLGSPKLLARLREVLAACVGAIREWYEAAKPHERELLVDVKIGEEVDVGANFYYYPGGNELWRASPHNSSADPTYGPNWKKGLSGGLPALGYNMLRTLGIRSGGGPPTREEIAQGVRAYFASCVSACVGAWPELARNGRLSAHAGAVGDPLLVPWDAPMVGPATAAYSFYIGPADTLGQPGLAKALRAHDPQSRRFAVAETFCFGCASRAEWRAYLEACFGSPYGNATYMRVYNVQPFLSSPGAVEALQDFVG